MSVYYVLLLLLLSNSLIFCQSKKIKDIGPNNVEAIYFVDLPGPPRIGFFSEQPVDIANNTFKVWRTSDGGNTWIEANISPDLFVTGVTDFTFKDSLTGWLACSDAIAPSGHSVLYKTGDGGITWKAMNFQGVAQGLYYNRSSNTLYLTSDNSSYYSTNEGQSWDQQFSENGIGIAFSNNIGVISGSSDVKKGGTINTAFHVTSDNGKSWTSLYPGIEAYQPLVIPGTSTIFVADEVMDAIYRSDDGGLNWRLIKQFNNVFISGCIKGNLCRLYIQSTSQGLMVSTDEGLTWESLSLITQEIDTRFNEKNNTIFVAQRSLSSEPASIWRYDLPLSPPHISVSGVFESTSCEPMLFPVHLWYGEDQCSKGRLIDASLTGSSAFELNAPTVPQYFTENDSLLVSYSGNNANDTAYLHLRFGLYDEGYERDTIIILIGKHTPPSSFQLELLSATPATKVGDNVSVNVIAKTSLASNIVKQIEFTLEYHGDLLGKPVITSMLPDAVLSVGNATRIGRVESIPVILTASSISFNQGDKLLDLDFPSYLTDTLSTTIRIKGFKVQLTEQYAGCQLPVPTDSLTITLNLHCGDSTIRVFMKDGTLPFQIISLSPNPTLNQLNLGVLNLGKGETAQCTITNLLGQTCYSETIFIPQDKSSVLLHLSELPKGRYWVELKGMLGSTRVSFVKN